MRRVNEQAMVEAMRENAKKSRAAFLEAFSQEERRLMMAHAYWDVAADMAEKQVNTVGVLSCANAAGSIAAGKSESSVSHPD